MTEQEQRIAIAEACGWKIVGYGYGPNHEPVFDRPDGTRSFGFESDFPNYTGDLNAILPLLPDGTTIRCWNLKDNLRMWLVRNATGLVVEGPGLAVVACEFYLRTLGKWKD